jgi:hypothetical protein
LAASGGRKRGGEGGNNAMERPLIAGNGWSGLMKTTPLVGNGMVHMGAEVAACGCGSMADRWGRRRGMREGWRQTVGPTQ